MVFVRSRIVHLENNKLGDINMENKLTHFDQNGRAQMVDVSNKVETARVSIAVSSIRMSE